ncbi:hypothetical protein CR513_11145, partial [Mucuna pruriens]
MKAFSFSLDATVKDWLYLQLVLFNTWGDMKCMFLEKFFPASRTVTIRKEICGIRQHSRETLHEYWERFNKLCATCPHHHISEQLLIQYFYEGLTMMDRSMIDVVSGGALMDKTLAVVRHLISNMASNTQQFGIKGASQPRMVNEIGVVDNLRLENQLTELTSLVRQLVVGQHQPNIATRVCGICTSVEHPIDMCPTLQETESDQPESVGAIGGYQYGKQLYQIRKATISAKAESRAIYRSMIRIHTECASKTNRLSTIDSAISSITVPTAVATENATSRQFAIFGGPNETVNNQQPGVPTNHANRTASQYCEPITISWIQQLTLTNNPESERKRECTYLEKRKRITSTSTATVSEIRRSRLLAEYQLTDVLTKQNCPITVSNSNHLSQEARI